MAKTKELKKSPFMGAWKKSKRSPSQFSKQPSHASGTALPFNTQTSIGRHLDSLTCTAIFLGGEDAGWTVRACGASSSTTAAIDLGSESSGVAVALAMAQLAAARAVAPAISPP